MRIISFNSRGLGGVEKSRYLRDIIRKKEVDMACIQETKMAIITREKCQSIWGDNNIDWLHNGEENGAAGILSVWNKNNFTLLKSKSGKGYIIIEGEWGENKQLVTIVNVYSPCTFSEKKVLWEELIKSRG